MFISDKISVEEDKGKSLFANRNIEKDEVLIRFEGKLLTHPTKTSFQIEKNKHLEGPGEIDNYLNHSCNSNGYINFDDLTFRSKRRILKMEELTFNYLTTELELVEPFYCECGSKNCLGFIRGFKYLSREQKESLKPRLSPFLRKS